MAGSYSNVDAVFSPGENSSSNSAFVYTTSTSTPAQIFTVAGGVCVDHDDVEPLVSQRDVWR